MAACSCESSQSMEMGSDSNGTNLAFLHPRLLTTVILLDPVIITIRPGQEPVSEIPLGIRALAHRPDLWRNRAKAASSVTKADRGWDKRVLDLIVEYGFRDLPAARYRDLPADKADAPVTLTTTKQQSVLTQVRPYLEYKKGEPVTVKRELYPDLDPRWTTLPVYRPETTLTMDRLPTLRASTLFILGTESNPFWLHSMRRAAKAAGSGVGGSGGMAEGRVREALVKGGHVFPFTIVGETARICAAWLGEEMGKFRQTEGVWEHGRAKMTERDHLVLPSKWMEMVPPPLDATGSKL